MLWPSEETLTLVEPDVPAALISSAAFAQAKALVAHLPDALSAYYLECRLGATASRVDLLACSVAADGGRQAIIDAVGLAGKLTPLLAEPLWQRISRFLTAWHQPATPLYDQVPFVWLEFDHIDQAVSALLHPNFHFCLEPAYGRKRTHFRPTQSLAPAIGKQLAQIGLACLQAEALSPQTEQNLALCFDVLPAHCSIPHLSTMLARQPAALKVNVHVAANVPNEHLIVYLKQVGWSGSLAKVEALLQFFRPSPTAVIVDLAVGDTVAPMIGFAFSQSLMTTQLGEDAELIALLDRCVESKLCSAEKRTALLGWPGRASRKYQRYAWPARLMRWLDVKIVCTADGSVEAKGYLGFAPRFSLF